MDFRKRTNISVDIVLFGFDGNTMNVLLNKRKLNLFAENTLIVDDWKLLGDMVFKSERLDNAADRIIKEVDIHNNIFFSQFRTFGNPKRINKEKDVLWSNSQQIDPQTISIAYYALTFCDNFTLNNNFKWFPIDALPELAFDHEHIINEAYEFLKAQIKIIPIIYYLLPLKFTLNTLIQAYETIYNTTLDNRNFRKKITSKPFIVKLEEKQRMPNSKKPGNLYMFSKDVYNKIESERKKIIL